MSCRSKTKKTCLIQEVVRILRNTNKDIDNSVKTSQLKEFSQRLKESGYREKMRGEIMKRGLEAHEKQIERDTSGVCPLSMPQRYDQKERTKKKRRKRTS